MYAVFRGFHDLVMAGLESDVQYVNPHKKMFMAAYIIVRVCVLL